MTSPGVGGESLRRRHSWDSWRRRFYGADETALQSSQGIPQPCMWMVAVSGISKMNRRRSRAIGVGGFARDNWRRRLSKIIE